MYGAVRSPIHGDMVLLSPRIWTRTAGGDDYHILYFENMQPICGHRNFRPPKIFDPLATRLNDIRGTYVEG